MRYPLPPAVDGEWVQPRRRGFFLQCCACGFVHRLDFRLHRRKIQFRAFRVGRRRRPRGTP